MGITSALVVQTVLFVSITLRTNWDKEVGKTQTSAMHTHYSVILNYGNVWLIIFQFFLCRLSKQRTEF